MLTPRFIAIKRISEDEYIGICNFYGVVNRISVCYVSKTEIVYLSEKILDSKKGRAYFRGRDKHMVYLDEFITSSKINEKGSSI